MNRVTVIKTAVAFLSGVACTFVGLKIWIEQPDQDRIKMALEGWSPVHGGTSTSLAHSYSPSTLWAWDTTVSPKYWPSDHEPTLAMVPLEPTLHWKAADLQDVCFHASAFGPELSIRFTPTEAAAMETRRLLGEALDKFGQGPRYALMLRPEGTLVNFDTNAGNLGYFDSQLESGADTASNMASFKLTFDETKWPLSMGIAQWVAETHPITDCFPEDTEAHHLMNNWLNRAFGDGAAEKMRAGPSRPEA